MFFKGVLTATATQPQTSPPPAKSQAVSYQLGVLYVQNSQGNKRSFPMQLIDVKVKREGNTTQVEVSQEFQNSYGETVDAIYLFPLPLNARVDELKIQVGDRTVPTDPKREEMPFPESPVQPKNQIPGLFIPQGRNFFRQEIDSIKPGETVEIKLSFTEGVN